MSSQKIIVANWKLERSFAQAHEWVTAHRNDLSELANRTHLVICPDIITTASLGKMLQGTGVFLGAQDCSPYISGKHTGAVSAQSLHEAGCTYAIIGHHEQRLRSTLTNADYALACNMALRSGIHPILCLGEASEGRPNKSKIKDLFASSLGLVYSQCRAGSVQNSSSVMYVAYEPAWAIGAENLPEADEITERIGWLRELIKAHDATSTTKILYGGGVTAENCVSLREIPHLDGLLLGSSSLDMQSLKKIVYSFIK